MASSLSRPSQKTLWKTSSAVSHMVEGGPTANANPPFAYTYRTHSGVSIPGLSSLSEPGLNLFPTVALGDEDKQEKPRAMVPPDIKDAQLRADIRAMGRMLGQVIQEYEGQGALCVCILYIYIYIFVGDFFTDQII